MSANMREFIEEVKGMGDAMCGMFEQLEKLIPEESPNIEGNKEITACGNLVAHIKDQVVGLVQDTQSNVEVSRNKLTELNTNIDQMKNELDRLETKVEEAKNEVRDMNESVVKVDGLKLTLNDLKMGLDLMKILTSTDFVFRKSKTVGYILNANTMNHQRFSYPSETSEADVTASLWKNLEKVAGEDCQVVVKDILEH